VHDIKANQLVSVIYDGTNFQMLSPIANVAIGGTQWILYRRTSDFTNTTTTYESITTLQFIVEANTNYIIHPFMKIISDGVFKLYIPSLTSVVYDYWLFGGIPNVMPTSAIHAMNMSASSEWQHLSNNVDMYITGSILVRGGATQGTFVMQIKLTSGAYTSVICKQHSYILVGKL